MKKKIVFLLLVFFAKICAHEELKFFVIITSYDNAKYVQKNLFSVLNQEHNNFEGVYIDDCSQDGTGTIVQQILKKYDSTGKIEYIRNSERRCKAANIWLTLHELNTTKKISDNDIIVILDGDDWYPHNHVFAYLNNLYHTNDIWLTYGGFIKHPPQTDKNIIAIPETVIRNNMIRYFHSPKSHYGPGSQQRTFYAWLYRRIKLSDFFFNGRFLPCASDIAKIIPMMEMAGHRFKCIEEKIYVYNRENIINDDKVGNISQGTIEEHVRMHIKPYVQLQRPEPRILSKESVDVIWATETQDVDLIGLFTQQLKNNFQNSGTIHIINTIQNNQQSLKENLLKICDLTIGGVIPRGLPRKSL